MPTCSVPSEEFPEAPGDVLGRLAAQIGLRHVAGTSPTGLPERYLYSPDMRYRYAFTRTWAGAGASTGAGSTSAAGADVTAVWILLNPATGDTEQRRRPTLDRAVSWSKSWGASAITIVNLFAYRATKPAELRTVDDPVGPHNDAVLDALTNTRKPGRPGWVIAAWGGDGSLRGRSRAVRATLTGVQCLGVTDAGEPRHPLYVPGRTSRVPLPG